MRTTPHSIVRALGLLLTGHCLFAAAAASVPHLVGDSIWSIPTSDDFYTRWAENRSFSVGDSLTFRFEVGFYDAVQVSRREFDDCTAENPFRSFPEGPATVRLNEEGVHYFVCSFGNYCRLGQKVAVSVRRKLPRRAAPPPP
ncbi:umecyanin-like [Zingiber officinale]|uniref:Phytocyanin domain-containing protein n=1 Tax=Zingiber officinale TaxID=94328 RepID=A0A8J5CQC8_ZINOF|nr:umecyanin-like [Zingiber officinale]XP_042452413.1 umecyanin-like [Zingiber officinale]KAG6466915.1 hypothetical protein ZIOFF_075286 [Zingiber officinale]KAG6508944.1 hypothetical protein ZIOFF_034326 [Zingiber officinale]